MNWNLEKNKRLTKAILSLKNEDEAQRFLRDLMTESEIAEFANRLRAAELLTLKVPYSSIVDETGLSSTTVARVSKWLNGNEQGYRLILDRLKKK